MSANAGSRPQFDLTLSLPPDERFAATIRALAIHAAEHAGCLRAQAEAFGRAAEELLKAYLEESTPHREIAVVVRRADGPLELIIDQHRITLDI